MISEERPVPPKTGDINPLIGPHLFTDLTKLGFSLMMLWKATVTSVLIHRIISTHHKKGGPQFQCPGNGGLRYSKTQIL